MRRLWSSVGNVPLVPPLPFAPVFGGSNRSENAVGLLLANPLEKRLESWCRLESFDGRVAAGQVVVGEDGVKLLMARAAQRRPIRRLAALLLGRQMVQRDEGRGHLASAKGTLDPRTVGSGHRDRS